jgi:hypothetical protein
MSKSILPLLVILSLAACSGGTSASKTADSGLVRCSSTLGPLAGSSETPADAGVIKDCQLGGKCLYVTAGPGQSHCSPTADGGFDCATSPPSWTCVTESGSSGDGAAGSP